MNVRDLLQLQRAFQRHWVVVATSQIEEVVRIGEDAVIGACSLVNRDIPKGATAVGIPCRIVKTAGE